MSSVTPPIYRTEMMSAVLDDVISRRTRYYLVTGNIDEWTDEPNPDASSSSDVYQRFARRNFVECNEFGVGEISLMIRRHTWTSGTVYDYYDESYSSTNSSYSGALSIADSRFYVINSENRIYKCIDNNYDSPSIVEPLGDTIDFIQTGDGYIWKYLYEIPRSLLQSFADPNNLPVYNATTSQFYNRGKIIEVNITNPGVNYDPDDTTLEVVGDGLFAAVEPVIDNQTGEITNVIITNNGQAYNTATIEVHSASGEGAEFQIVFDVGDVNTSHATMELSAVTGQISLIRVENQGVNYTQDAELIIKGDGNNAVGELVVNEFGRIEKVNLINRGSGYSWVELEINDPTGFGANLRTIMAPRYGHGRDAIRELFPHSVCFSKLLSESLIPGTFRQACIIKDLREFSVNTSYIDAIGSFCHRIEISGNWSNLSPGDIVKDANLNEFKIISIDGQFAYILSADNQFVTGTQLQTLDESITLNVEAVTNPDVDRFSGSLMYIDNKYPYNISSEEFSFFRLFINF